MPETKRKKFPFPGADGWIACEVKKVFDDGSIGVSVTFANGSKTLIVVDRNSLLPHRGSCPECGSKYVSWRQGAYFDGEKICSKCSYAWRP